MTTYETRLLARQDVAQGTTAFHLAKPDGFTFRPGQAFEIILPGTDKTASKGDTRHAFSIVTAPHEPDLVFTTRMRDSAYKRALGALPIGTKLQIDGPFGSLTLHKNQARAGVLVAGGIGITPFMSILRHAAHEKTPQDLMLLYSNRRPEDSAFLPELQELAQHFPKFKLVATMTDMAHSAQDWTGETGLMDAAFIRRTTKNLPKPIFYLCGPPAMVAAMRTILAEAGMDEDDIRAEEFFGY